MDDPRRPAATVKAIRWRRVSDYQYCGYIGKDVEVRFTLLKHSPPNNSHFSIWTLHRGDVGCLEDAPAARAGKVGTFPTKRDAQAKAEQLAAESAREIRAAAPPAGDPPTA